MEQFKPEKPEQRKNVNLRIIPPMGDKHVMIAFDAQTDKQARVYNDALAYHLRKLDGFH